jgi:hypothetical protein
LKFENHHYYNCQIELDSGDTFRVSANWLHNNQLDHWQGWLCDAGYLRLHIDKDFNVHSAVCQNQSLGNLFGEWQVLDQPGMCQRERCVGCTDDLLIGKHAVPATAAQSS